MRRRPSPSLRPGPGSTRAHDALDEVHARATAGLHQRGQQGAVVYGVIARDLDATTQGGAQRGHEAPAFAGAPPFHLEAERMLVGEEIVEAGAVRGIERHGHGAGGVVPDRLSRRLLQRGGKAGPETGTLEEQRRQGGLAELGLGDRGEHSGRHPRGAVASGRRCHERHVMTVAGQLPRGREPDDTAPHDLDLHRHASSLRGAVVYPFLSIFGPTSSRSP